MRNKALRNGRKSAVPPEFRLAVECCRWWNEPGRADAVAEAAGRVDWAKFLATVERHRVAGLAWSAIHSLNLPIPQHIEAELSNRSNIIAAHGLQAAIESAELSAALDRSGIPHLFVKGLAVGALAYSSPFAKHSWDIDLLVDGDCIAEAAALLEEIGFDLIFPRTGRDWSRLAKWHRVQKDSAWRHRQTGVMVELHSRLADNRLLIPTIGVSSPRRQVSVADGLALSTLAWPEMFAHLCVHGASSAWFRLKWIADLAALLSRSGDDFDELYESSQRLGAGRAAAQALLLAETLFETGIGAVLMRRLESQAVNRRLAAVAFDQLQRPEPGWRAFGTGMIHASQFFLLPGAKFKMVEARRQAATALSNLLD